jgi:hypothetical protein
MLYNIVLDPNLECTINTSPSLLYPRHQKLFYFSGKKGSEIFVLEADVGHNRLLSLPLHLWAPGHIRVSKVVLTFLFLSFPFIQDQPILGKPFLGRDFKPYMSDST